ncbi:MAG TPA: Mur ligase domain-containing protein, partial [Ktedonobacterales bacterium]
MSITAADLLAAIPVVEVTGPLTAPISGVVYDSRQVGPGACFVAYAGVSTDGHDYIAQALAAGAALVVGERPVPADFPSDR